MTSTPISEWKVLIVEDDEDNLSVVEQLLSFRGARVFTTPNGRDVLALLRQEHPTVVLLDISMPEMDGWATIKAIRENSETRTIPVIALTAHAMTGDQERVLAAGFDGYITKPIEFASFFQMIQECLDRLASKNASPALVEAKPEAAPLVEARPEAAPPVEVKAEPAPSGEMPKADSVPEVAPSVVLTLDPPAGSSDPASTETAASATTARETGSMEKQ
jgi:CheY-like chemotaxis protein